MYMWNNIALKLFDIFTYRPQDKNEKTVIKYKMNKRIKKQQIK